MYWYVYRIYKKKLNAIGKKFEVTFDVGLQPLSKKRFRKYLCFTS